MLGKGRKLEGEKGKEGRIHKMKRRRGKEKKRKK